MIRRLAKELEILKGLQGSSGGWDTWLSTYEAADDDEERHLFIH